MTPTRLVIHNTANDASATNEIAYMISNTNQTSFHFAVDDESVVQGVLLDRNSWNAGDGGSGIGNRQGISIEICYSKSGGDRFIAAEKKAVELIVFLLRKYGWGIDKVTKHQDYSGKYCPHRTLDMGWNRFVAMVDTLLNPPAPVEPPEPIEYPFPVGMTIYPDEDINLLKTAGYADATPLLIQKGVPCIVGKYHSKNGLYMALTNEKGVYFSSAWTKEFNKFSYTSPYMEEIERLKKEVELLASQLKELKATSEAEMLTAMAELKEVSDKLTTETIARKTAQNTSEEAVRLLNEYKLSHDWWLGNLVDAIHKAILNRQEQNK